MSRSLNGHQKIQKQLKLQAEHHMCKCIYTYTCTISILEREKIHSILIGIILKSARDGEFYVPFSSKTLQNYLIPYRQKKVFYWDHIKKYHKTIFIIKIQFELFSIRFYQAQQTLHFKNAKEMVSSYVVISTVIYLQ